MWLRLCDKLESYGLNDIPLYEGYAVVNLDRNHIGFIEQVLYDTFLGIHDEELWFAAEICVNISSLYEYWPLDEHVLIWDYETTIIELLVTQSNQ